MLSSDRGSSVGEAQANLNPVVVDFEFPLVAEHPDGGEAVIPADHGYALYGAISRRVPQLHGNAAVGIHPIRGRAVGGRALALTSRSRLVLRLPADALAPFVGLAGSVLEVDGANVRVGVPSVRALAPASRLRCRLSVIKGMLDAQPFLNAARAQAEKLAVATEIRLVQRRPGTALEAGIGSRDLEWLRRTVAVHGKTVVGYALEADGLSPSDSIRLQAVGIGGRRRFGCGIFVPTDAAQ